MTPPPVYGMAESVWQEEEDAWPPERFAEALAPFLAEYGELLFNHEARQTQNTRIVQTGPRTWDVTQVLIDPQGDNFWHVDAHVDLRSPESFEGPLLRLRRIGA